MQECQHLFAAHRCGPQGKLRGRGEFSRLQVQSFRDLAYVLVEEAGKVAAGLAKPPRVVVVVMVVVVVVFKIALTSRRQKPGHAFRM